MKKLFYISLALLLLTAPPLLAEGEESFEGEVTIGGHISDINDYGGKVGEYEQTSEDGTIDGELKMKGANDGVYWQLYARPYDSMDQDYSASLDFRRILKASYSFHKLPHWLDNDPLTNIDSKMGGKMNTYENLEVDADYVIAYSEHEAAMDLAIPSMPNLTFNFGYREQMRQGHRQQLSVSHCGNCHVEGVGREVDESTRDLIAGATLRAGVMTMDYTYLTRAFSDSASTPSRFYDNAMHPVRGEIWTDPETGDDVNYGVIFNARLQFEDETRPVGLIPDVDKDSHKVRARFDLPGSASLVASAISASVENQWTGLATDSTGFHAQYTDRWGERNKWRFNMKVRHQSIDNDDIFIDVENSEAYESRWGGDFDYLRQSSLNRDVTTAGADLSYRSSRKMNIRGGVEWKSTDREHYLVADDETRTDAIRLYASLNLRPTRKFRARLTVKHDDISNPFASPNAVCESDIDDTADRQYWMRRGFRTGDVGAQPSSADQLRATATWSLNTKSTLSANIRWSDQSNDDLTYADWNRTLFQPGLTYNLALNEKAVFTAGYLRIQEETDTLFSIPVMDG